ncbi:MAG: elongation factor Ts [Thermoanaerobaculaceae bacterium]|jgi:elongation factor Ts|nr:elongation factor Ts [Thermoanaerobaculaceae bacterium]
MAVTAAMVKELREKTGAGMMDCQRALQEAGGNMDEAVKILRKRGLSAAAKKAGRATKDGLVAVAITAGGERAGMVELNCETDFVARTEQYQAFARSLAEQVAAEQIGDVEALKSAPYASDPAHTVAEAVAAQIATIGENIVLSRAVAMQAGAGEVLGSYTHMGGKIGVLVKLSAGADDEVVKDVAMHIAAAEPRFLAPESVPEAVLAEEREIARAQVPPGKPEQVVAKIVEGKVAKFFEQACLVEQPFVKNPDQKIKDMLAARGGARVLAFARFRLGEGVGA